MSGNRPYDSPNTAFKAAYQPVAEVCAGENGGLQSDSRSWNPVVSNNSAARESVAVTFFRA